MKIGAMNHPARNPLEEIDWFGRHGFDFVDLTLEPPAADPAAVRAAPDRLGPKLLHVHLSENDGTADQHLPLGAAPRSTTGWPQHVKKLKAAGYDGTITLEVFAPHREYLLLSRDLLRKWWDGRFKQSGT